MAFKFGRQQIGKPTPASIAFKITIISVCCPAIQIWLATATYIPNGYSNIIGSILGLIILLANALKPMFGVDITEKTVPSKDVTGIEDKPETQ